ncbi:MAG: VOC family protein [bacterium]
MSGNPGSICHLEVFAIDLNESAKFYGDLFGWTTDPHDAGYLFWEDTEGMTGGFTTAGSPVTNPAATFYIRVKDIMHALANVQQAGGVVIREKTEIGGDNGYYALFRDPAGNNVGLFCRK